MNNTCSLLLFGVATLYFAPRALRVAIMLVRLFVALAKGVVKWPGPRIHDPGRSASRIRLHLGIRYENLFPEFLFNSFGVLGAFVFSLLMFLAPLLPDYVWINWTVMLVVLIVFSLVGGAMGYSKARQHMAQLNALLSDLERDVEPRDVDGRSARSEYAIEHPLIGARSLSIDTRRALDQLYESVRCLQEGGEFRSLNLYNEAMRSDPSLHEHAREALADLAQDCRPADAGAVYYWMGLHSEYLMDRVRAADYYQKAVDGFERIGYRKRASRACNNLGSAKLQLGDPSCIETFEQAIDLDPSNGMAYISIGVTYYRISNRGDPRFETALNAFADAVAIDPAAYGPVVLSRIRSIGYTWKEDWEDIKQRVARREAGFGVETGGPVKGACEPTIGFHVPESAGLQHGRKRIVGFEFPESAEPQHDGERTIGFQVPKPVPEPTQTYRNKEQGFEIDIPEKWRLSRISGSGPGDLVQYGCYEEAFNFLTAPLSPEPPLDQTERDFVQHAIRLGFSQLAFGRITVGGKEHVCAKYRILDRTSERWNKKYMIVLDEIEYTITGTSDIKDWFVKREKDWDAIVRTFRPLGKSD